jgi:hypothetical protein
MYCGFDTSGDLGTDLLTANGFQILLGNGNCSSGVPIYDQLGTSVAFRSHQSGNTITASTSGSFPAETATEAGDLPVVITIKANAVKGTGTLTIKGPADLSTLATSNAVILFTLLEPGSDADSDFGCANLTVKTHPAG